MRTLEATINGKDGGGFVYQNVFHVNTDDDATAVPTLLSDFNDYVDATLTALYVAAKAVTNRVLTVASRVILATPSFSVVKNINEQGTRMGDESVGAIAGKLVLYPDTGNRAGHQYVNGSLIGDFSLDVINPTYAGLLNDLADGFNLIDGGDATYHWQLVLFHKKLSTTTDIDEVTTQESPCCLSKRIRA